MSRHVLIVGGHGRIAQIVTQQLLKKSWTVTSLIRSQDHVSQINSLVAANQGSLNVLVRNLEHVYDTFQARSILDEVKPDTVVWCVEAGGEARHDRVRDVSTQSKMTTDNLTRLLPSIKMLPLTSLRLQSKRRLLKNYFSSRISTVVESDPAGGIRTPGDTHKRCRVAVP
jgi:GDP-D-mannose dehydratase